MKQKFQIMHKNNNNSSLSVRISDLRDSYNKAWEVFFRNGNNGDMSIDDRLFAIYVLMFGEAPNKILSWDYPTYMKDRTLTDNPLGDKCIDGSEEQTEKWENVLFPNTVHQLERYFKANDIAYFCVRYEQSDICVTERKEFFYNFGNMEIMAPYRELPAEILDCIVFSEDTSTTFYYMAAGKDGYEVMDLQAEKMDIDIETNYNDDIPYNEIVSFLNNDQPGLVVMRGEPGTAKSSLIRHLITIIDKDFIYLDASCFDNMIDASLIKELLEYEGSILILEDCEEMLKNRTDGNTKLAALLNMSSGLLADSFKFKIICTFNAAIDNIDPALLRKGRMRINYEFKKLTAEKTAALARKLGKDIPDGEEKTCGDIYNYDEVVEFGSKKKKKIGFLG